LKFLVLSVDFYLKLNVHTHIDNTIK